MYQVKSYLIPFMKETGSFGNYRSLLQARKRLIELKGKLKYEVFHVVEMKEMKNKMKYNIKYNIIVL